MSKKRPRINTDLLEQTMVHIEEHPEDHNQKYWGNKAPCGTKFCFAGNAAVLNGAKPLWDDIAESISVRDPEGHWKTVLSFPMRAVYWEDEYSQERADSPFRYGRDILGLTEDEADELFNGYNTVEVLRRMVDTFISRQRARDEKKRSKRAAKEAKARAAG